MKKIVPLFALLIAVSSLQACTTFVYERGGDGDGWNRGGWNRGDNDGRRGDGGHRASVNIASDLSDSTPPLSDSQSSASLLANDYSVSISTANKIINFAAGSNLNQSLQDLNLTTEEATAIANLNMPSDATVDKVATQLGESSVTIKKIFADFVQDTSNSN